MNLYEIDNALSCEKDRVQGALQQISGHLSQTFFNPTNSASAYRLDQGDALQDVLDFTRELIHAEKCALFLVDITGSSLVLERASGAVDFNRLKDVATYDLRSGNSQGGGVTPWVLLRKKPFNARNFDELRFNSEGHWKGNWDVPMYGGQDEARAKFQCVYMVPLLAGDRPLGVLKYENRTSGHTYFDQSDERLIDIIAALVSALVISQRIERNRYDQILPTISMVLLSHLDKPSFYDALLQQCRRILCADLCSLFLLDDRGNLVLKSIVGLSDEKRRRLRGFGYADYTSADGLTPWILKRGSSFNVRSFPDLKGRSEGHHMGKWDNVVYDSKPEENFKSLYSIPLVIGEDRIGVFKVENKTVPPYYFTESDERLFDLIGRLIAVGVRYDRARQSEQYLYQMARAAELGFLAAGISHEFNNYLQRFLVTAQNALVLCENEDVCRKLYQIIEDIEVASTLVEDFRDIRNRAKEATNFDLDRLVKQITDTSHQRFLHHKVVLEYNNPDVREVRLNPGDVQAILINLLNNAFESMNYVSGQRLIKVSVYPEDENSISVNVADSGSGIPLEQRELIFAPFYTTKEGGMGVGLYWVRRLVSGIGGRIVVDSPNELGGTTFRIMLPQGVEE